MLIIGQASLNLEMIHKATASEHTKGLWDRFYKVAVKFFEVVKFASDTRKSIEVISPFVRLLGGGPGKISPMDSVVQVYSCRFSTRGMPT